MGQEKIGENVDARERKKGRTTEIALPFINL
jgi:hypothetical protein